jgi:hypothetical protein
VARCSPRSCFTRFSRIEGTSYPDNERASLIALLLKPVRRAPDDQTADPEPRQEQMQPTGQMNASEMPKKEGKPADQCTGQSPKKEEESSGSGSGQSGQQGRPRNYWHAGLFSCWDDVGTCESHSILMQNEPIHILLRRLHVLLVSLRHLWEKPAAT